MNMKLLTISIPTYNRALELSICLRYLSIALDNLELIDKDSVEIKVFDNSENNDTEKLFETDEFIKFKSGYSKNSSNIGSDANIAQCYLRTESLYVLALGDDDYLEKDFFNKILPLLAKKMYSLISVNAFGYTLNHTEKRPLSSNQVIEFTTAIDIVIHRNIHLGFISGLILRCDLLSDTLIKSGIGTQLVQVNAAFAVLSNSPNSAFVTNYLIGATRNNTGGYSPIDIFVTQFFKLLDAYGFFSMNRKEEDSLKLRLLFGFYTRSFSQYIRNRNLPLNNEEISTLDGIYKDFILYRLIVRSLLLSSHRFSFYMLNGIYIASNILFNPHMIYYYFRHSYNLIKK